MAHITSHAVERFISRHASHMAFNEAKAFLERSSLKAAPLKERTIKGDFQWQIEDPYCILVMKKDFQSKDWVCVTVLPEPQGSTIPEHEMDILRDHIYDQESSGKIQEEILDRVLASAGVSNLMRPSGNPEAEVERIEAERRIWNRVVNLLAVRFKTLRESEAQLSQNEQDEKNKTQALRYVLNHLKGSNLEYLLAYVEELDPKLVSDSFLMPELFDTSDRKNMLSVREEMKSILAQV